MNRSIVPPLAFLFLLPALPSTAVGQERIELSSTPNLSVYEAVLPLGKRWKRQRSGEGTSAAWSLGAGFGQTNEGSGGTFAGGAAIGWRSPSILLGARSELTGFIPAEGEGLDLADARGKHRAVGIAHLGHRGDDFGVHLLFDGWARHSGGQPFRLDAPRYGAAPLTTAGGALGFITRFGDGDMTGAGPVELTLEETMWDRGALASARSMSVAMGLGLMPAPRDGVRGTFELLRMKVEHTDFERRAELSSESDPNIAGAGIIADDFRKVTLGMAMDKLTFFDKRALGTFDFHLGHSWIESDIGTETLRAKMIDFHFGTNVKFGKRGDSSRFSFGVSRDPNRNASGSRILSEWRSEISTALDKGPVELGAGGAISWLSSKAGGDGAATPTLIRYATQIDAFYKLPLNFQVGGYLASSFEQQGTFDPWAAERGWNSEAGLLLRWKRGANPKKKPVAIARPPQPQPRPIQRPIQFHAR